MVGIAGNKRRLPQQPSWYFVDGDFTPDHSGNLSGQIFSWQTQTLSEKPDPKALVSHLYGLLFQSVKLLDGLFLAGYSQTFSDHHLRFEEQFDFDFYALDLSRQAEQKGLKVGTWPIAVIHESCGNDHSTAWQKAYSQYLQKWEPEAYPNQ